jgi:hypothetical protein
VTTLSTISPSGMVSPVAGSRAVTNRCSSSAPLAPLARAFANTRSATPLIVLPSRTMARAPGCGIEGGKRSEVSATFQIELARNFAPDCSMNFRSSSPSLAPKTVSCSTCKVAAVMSSSMFWLAPGSALLQRFSTGAQAAAKAAHR